MKTIQDVRDDTFDDLCDKLLKYGMCMVVRPTGFGKTYMTARLMSMFNKVLFLYPTNIIADVVRDVYGDKDNVTYMSYQGFIRMDVSFMEEYDLIVCDECHRLGADRTNSVLKSYLATHRNCKLVGLTATPQRTDSFSVLSDLFNGIQVFSYTTHDAIKDGFILKPYYCFMSYGYKKDVEASLKAGLKGIDVEVDELIKKKLYSEYSEEAYKIFGKDKIIRDICDKYLQDRSYMKFMWFFPTKKTLLQGYEEVVNDFKSAYPNHEVNPTIIISSYEYRKNTELLSDLVRKENKIDIIFSVDMLNMGYHVSDVTGVGLCRATDSSIIFNQQIGRCMNTVDVDSEPKVIFDFVDNLSRRAVYETGRGMDSDGIDIDSESQDVNCLTGDDIVVIGNIASYKMFISKVFVEPKRIMCRRAYWKFKQFGGGKDRPDVPIDAFAMLYGVTVDDVLNEMGIKDIYDDVNESTRVPEEVLNETGVYKYNSIQ